MFARASHGVAIQFEVSAQIFDGACYGFHRTGKLPFKFCKNNIAQAVAAEFIFKIRRINHVVKTALTAILFNLAPGKAEKRTDDFA